MKILNRIEIAATLTLSIWSSAHSAAVNAMTEWGVIVQNQPYKPMTELWGVSFLAIISMIYAIYLIEREIKNDKSSS